MSSEKPKNYDSTIMRIAGNIIGHLAYREEVAKEDAVGHSYCWEPTPNDVRAAVRTARAIVAETLRADPEVKP